MQSNAIPESRIKRTTNKCPLPCSVAAALVAVKDVVKDVAKVVAKDAYPRIKSKKHK
jgi:hypothetical protein